MLSRAGWGWHVETGLHCLRMMLGGVFDRFPTLKIIIGHMGEDLPFSLIRADTVLASETKHLQRSIAGYFHEHFYVTTSGYFTNPPFLCALQVVGADRLMFSVDYPFSAMTKGRSFLDGISVSPDDLAKIAHGNADRLLRL
jgi:predicted TIM-barrel fold metal-dependent hydrolase